MQKEMRLSWICIANAVFISYPAAFYKRNFIFQRYKLSLLLLRLPFSWLGYFRDRTVRCFMVDCNNLGYRIYYFRIAHCIKKTYFTAIKNRGQFDLGFLLFFIMNVQHFVRFIFNYFIINILH